MDAEDGMDEKLKALEVPETRAEPAPASTSPYPVRGLQVTKRGEAAAFHGTAPSPPTPESKPAEASAEANKKPKPDVHDLFGERWFPRDMRRRKD